MSRSALAHLKGEKEFSLGGYLAPPVMFAKCKGIPVERSDFSRGKGYSARRKIVSSPGLSANISDGTLSGTYDLWMNVWFQSPISCSACTLGPFEIPMSLHPDFLTSPYSPLIPEQRWFHTDEALRSTAYETLLPPLVVSFIEYKN
jgi:hypothetical protein